LVLLVMAACAVQLPVSQPWASNTADSPSSPKRENTADSPSSPKRETTSRRRSHRSTSPRKRAKKDVSDSKQEKVGKNFDDLPAEVQKAYRDSRSHAKLTPAQMSARIAARRQNALTKASS